MHAKKSAPAQSTVQNDYDSLVEFLYLAPVGIIQSDALGEIILANPMATQILMPLAGDLGLNNLLEIFGRIYPYANQMIAAGDECAGTICEKHRFEARDASGKKHGQFLEISLQKTADARLMTLIRDVSESVFAQRELQERTLKLDLVVSGSNDGVWIWNVETGEAQYSQRWRQLVGLETEELEGIDAWMSRVHPGDAERLRAAIRSHLEGVSQFLHEDYRIRHADGTYRWMWCRGKCHRSDDGRPVLIAGTQTDVHALRSLDFLTGLPNEEAMLNRIEELLATKSAFQLMIVGFPRLLSMMQDLRIGALDELRKLIARRISAALPFDAYLGRIQGDYFLVIAPGDGTGSSNPEQITHRLSDAFAVAIERDDRSICLDLTIGAMNVVDGSIASSSDAMRDAWISYRCARQRDAFFNILDESQLADARERVAMEREVRRSIAHNWFVPYFQPIVDLSTGKNKGFEVLARMDHPELGLLAPGRFIGVAESVGLLPALGERMLEHAADLLRTWQSEGGEQTALFLSVNVDATQLMAQDFITYMEILVGEGSFPPHLLKLELVENTFIESFELASSQIAKLRDLGVQIALDDFGTGYSSFEYLRELSVNLIKIDKSFVDDIDKERSKAEMLRALCAISNLTGAETCIEGVESVEQAETARQILSDVGKVFAQGYYFDKPLSKNELLLQFAASKSAA